MRVPHGAAAAGVFILITVLTACAVLTAVKAQRRYHSSEASYGLVKNDLALEAVGGYLLADMDKRLMSVSREGDTQTDFQTLEEAYPGLSIIEIKDGERVATVSLRDWQTGSRQLDVVLRIPPEGEPNRRCRVEEWVIH